MARPTLEGQLSGSGAMTDLAETAAAADAATASQVEWMRDRVLMTERALEEAQERCIHAERQMESAAVELSSAESDLSACEARQSVDDDLDCSCEAHAVAVAEQRFEQAKESLSEVHEARHAALQRLEYARTWEARVGAELTQVRERCFSGVATVSAEWEAALQEIARRVSHLQEYVREETDLASAQGTTAVQDVAGWSLSSWLTGEGSPRRAWQPDDLASRFRLAPQDLRTFTHHLALANPAFRGEVARRRAEWNGCSGAADCERVFVQVKRTTAGLWSEQFVREALSPLTPSITTQRRTMTSDGDTTVTDLVLGKVNHPIVLGRGEGRFVPAGGSLAVEVKARRAHGFLPEVEHLTYQVAGHAGESASLVIVTRDIHDLGGDRAAEFRCLVRDAGSAVWALLPRKEEIDQLCWNLIRMPEKSP